MSKEIVKSETIGFRINKKYGTYLKVAAVADDRSLSDFVRRIVTRAIEDFPIREENQ